MFTGLVQELGTVEKLEDTSEGVTLHNATTNATNPPMCELQTRSLMRAIISARILKRARRGGVPMHRRAQSVTSE